MFSDFPLEARVENTNLCNASCVICPHGRMTRPKGVMAVDQFKTIVDECGFRTVWSMHLYQLTTL